MRNTTHPPDTEDRAEMLAVQLLLQGLILRSDVKGVGGGLEWADQALPLPAPGTWMAPRRAMNDRQTG